MPISIREQGQVYSEADRPRDRREIGQRIVYDVSSRDYADVPITEVGITRRTDEPSYFIQGNTHSRDQEPVHIYLKVPNRAAGNGITNALNTSPLVNLEKSKSDCVLAGIRVDYHDQGGPGLVAIKAAGAVDKLRVLNLLRDNGYLSPEDVKNIKETDNKFFSLYLSNENPQTLARDSKNLLEIAKDPDFADALRTGLNIAGEGNVHSQRDLALLVAEKGGGQAQSEAREFVKSIDEAVKAATEKEEVEKLAQKDSIIKDVMSRPENQHQHVPQLAAAIDRNLGYAGIKSTFGNDLFKASSPSDTSRDELNKLSSLLQQNGVSNDAVERVKMTYEGTNPYLVNQYGDKLPTHPDVVAETGKIVPTDHTTLQHKVLKLLYNSSFPRKRESIAARLRGKSLLYFSLKHR